MQNKKRTLGALLLAGVFAFGTLGATPKPAKADGAGAAIIGAIVGYGLYKAGKNDRYDDRYRYDYRHDYRRDRYDNRYDRRDDYCDDRYDSRTDYREGYRDGYSDGRRSDWRRDNGRGWGYGNASKGGYGRRW